MLLCESRRKTCSHSPTVTKYKASSFLLTLCRALLVLLALLALLAPVVVVMTSVLKETSTGLTSLAHHHLSDPRIMKLMLLWNLSTTRLRLFLLQKALGRTQRAHAVTWDSATQNGAVVGWDVQPEWPFSQVRLFKISSHWYLEEKGIWVKTALCEIIPT